MYSCILRTAHCILTPENAFLFFTFSHSSNLNQIYNCIFREAHCLLTPKKSFSFFTFQTSGSWISLLPITALITFLWLSFWNTLLSRPTKDVSPLTKSSSLSQHESISFGSNFSFNHLFPCAKKSRSLLWTGTHVSTMGSKSRRPNLKLWTEKSPDVGN